MAINLKKYYAVLGSAIKSQNSGGRLFSAQFNQELPNGIIGVMGKTIAGSPEVKEFRLPTAEDLKGAELCMVMKPEIVSDQSSLLSGAIGKFRNKANKPFPVVPLEARDRIVLSEDFLTKGSAIAVGDEFVLNADGLLEHAESVDSAVNKYKFVVTNIEVSCVANYVLGDGSLAPTSYKVYTVEMILA